MIGQEIDYPTLRKMLSKEFLRRKGRTSDLANRVKQCYQLLARIPQKDEWSEEDDNVRELLDTKLPTLCKSMTQAHCLRSKHKAVKLYSACCFVDLLRIYAPDAPFSTNEIKEIFNLIRQHLLLTGAVRKEKDYQIQLVHYHILESLAIVQSHLCLLELPLELNKLIETVCSVVREGTNPNVRKQCLRILDCIIEESEVIDYSIQSILYKRLVSPLREKAPAQRELVGSLLRPRVKEFQPLIKDFIQETLFDSSVQHYEIRKEHRYDLIKSLIDLRADLLIDAIPALRSKLEDEDEKARHQQVQFWSSVFKTKRTRPDEGHDDIDLRTKTYFIPQSLQCIYIALLERFSDICTDIRVQMCEDAVIFAQQTFHQEELVDKLSARCQDTEAKVRLTAVRSICTIAKMYPNLINEANWKRVLERTMDKKECVRLETFVQATDVFKEVIRPFWKNCEIPPKERKVFLLTPGIIFKSLFLLSAEKRNEFGYFLLERLVMSDLFLGQELSVAQRTRIFIQAVQAFSNENLLFLRNYIRKKRQIQQALAGVLRKRKQLYKEPNNQILKQDLVTLQRFLAGLVPCVGGNARMNKGSQFIQDLLNEVDKNVFTLLTKITNSQSTFADFVNAREQLITGLRSRNKMKRKLWSRPLVKICCPRAQQMMMQVNYVEYVDVVVTRTAFWLLPVDSVPHLLRAMIGVEEPGGGIKGKEVKYRQAARNLLSTLAESLPELFDSQSILNVISSSLEQASYSTRCRDCLFTLLPNACRSTKAPRGLQEYLKKVIHSDSSPWHVAQSLLAFLRLKGETDPSGEVRKIVIGLKNLVSVKDLTKGEALDIETKLMCLTMVGKQFPKMLESSLGFDETFEQRIQEFVWQLLDRVEEDPRKSKGKGPRNWSPLLTKAKLQGIRCLVQYLLSRSRVSSAESIASSERRVEKVCLLGKARPVFKKLLNIIYCGGGTGEKFESQSCQEEADDIMLTCALGTLDLCSSPTFSNLMKPRYFQMIAKVATVDKTWVREKFLKSILERVLRRKLHSQWTVILSLVANDPDKKLRQHVEKGIRQHVKNTRQLILCCGNIKAEVYPEYILAYHIHLLAHHPDLHPQDIHLELELKFILNCILKSPTANMALIWKILEKIKIAEDGQKGDRQTAKLHKFADMAGKFVKINFKGHRESKFVQPFNLPPNFYEVGNNKTYQPQGRELPSRERLLHQGVTNLLTPAKQHLFSESPILSLKRPRNMDNRVQTPRNLRLGEASPTTPAMNLSPLNYRPSKRTKQSNEKQSSQSSGSLLQSGVSKNLYVEQFGNQRTQSKNTTESQSSYYSSKTDTEISNFPEESPGSHRKELTSSQSAELDNSSQSSLL